MFFHGACPTIVHLQRRWGMHGVTEVLLRHSDTGWMGTMMMGEDVSIKHGGFNMF